MTEKITVVIADDHPPTRAGVCMALEEAGFSVVAEASDAPSAVEFALEWAPDICLLDIQMPGDGIDAARKITAALPDTAVVMLTVSTDEEHLFRALRAGAAGYLLKDIDPERLPHALHGVLRGEAAIPRTLVARVLAEFRTRSGKQLWLRNRRGVGLTSREWDILQMMRDRMTTAEMAGRLGVAPVTVRTHIRSILKKLQVEDREAAVDLIET